MIKNKKYSEIIDKLGLSPADFHKRNIMETYLDNFWKKQVEYPRNEDFNRSIMMALYTIDGIKDPNKIVLVDTLNFDHDDKSYTISSYQMAWQGNKEQLRVLTEIGVLHTQVKKLIDKFNSEDITKIFIHELFSNIVITNEFGTYDPKIEIRFISRFLVEKKDEGIKLLESNGL